MANELYFRLSAMMFLEYAIWGAWMPVLASRLLGPLKFSGKQTSWIYNTLPLGCMIAAPLAGSYADTTVDPRWILVGAHAAGAVLLLAASRIRNYPLLLVVMFLYSACYAATLPLVNSVMFAHLGGYDSGKIFIWAPIAWALVGYTLTGFRMSRKTEGDGSDCLVFAALLSFVMVAVCAIQPATAPQEGGQGIFAALSLLKEHSFLIFIIVQALVVGTMQFYFMCTAQYLQSRGMSAKKVPATMAVAQAVQALATYFALTALLGDARIGMKWTLTIGAGCWALLYLFYVARMPKFILVAAQSLHGLAYVFFVIAGQIFVSSVATKEMGNSSQALIIWVQSGLSVFIGTLLAGFAMDRFSVEGKFQWGKIFSVPLGFAAVGAIVLAALFHPAAAPAQPAAEPPAATAPATGEAPAGEGAAPAASEPGGDAASGAAPAGAAAAEGAK